MVVLQGLGWSVWWSRRVNGVESRLGGRRRSTPVRDEGAGRPVAPAAPAQHRSPAQAEAGRGVAQVHGQADLVLEAAGDGDVVEIHDHVVGGPGHGDQAEQAGTEEADGPAQRQRGLDQRAVGEAGALHSHH